ncbi:hypothetical protein [Desulfococcus sp.]|uniref:hypothetical protein n=1 Tax=Desulfococcus sp. TaxID=2025834 RepID=UPI0035938A88
MTESSIPRIHVSPDTATELAPLFQKGIRVSVETGCTIRSLLQDQWAIPPDYITGRISTMFLNGKPLDDMDEARVRDGDVLALSSAMPGLVGAVMRRGGFYASLRGGITYHEAAAEAGVLRGTITVKLFNLLIRELGPGFLAHGFRASRRDLPDGVLPADDSPQAHNGDVFIIAPPPPSA